MTGRFAPSPTGALHVGNLRTALAAWLMARSTGRSFVLRIEDLDRSTSSIDHERSQLRDLAALGIDWDNDERDPVWRQSERFEVYRRSIDSLRVAGATYECYCSRREVRVAAGAPHGPGDLVYPGTCRDLDDTERAARRAVRPPALRFRAGRDPVVVDDVVAGRFVGVPHDVVLRRNDGVPGYNIAVVVDDAAQGVDQVVRADDLLAATPSHIELQRALGLPTPGYAHVALVVGPSGERLAKRDGAVTLADLHARGVEADDVRRGLAGSLGIRANGHPLTAARMIDRFDPTRLPERRGGSDGVTGRDRRPGATIAFADLSSAFCDRSGTNP